MYECFTISNFLNFLGLYITPYKDFEQFLKYSYSSFVCVCVLSNKLCIQNPLEGDIMRMYVLARTVIRFGGATRTRFRTIKIEMPRGALGKPIR